MNKPPNQPAPPSAGFLLPIEDDMTLPRVELKALELLKSGLEISKHDLAIKAPCDPRTAQRTLLNLHRQQSIRIAAWVPIYKQHIPVYAIGEGKSATKPRGVSDKIRARRWRENNPEYCMDAAIKKRSMRKANKLIEASQ